MKVNTNTKLRRKRRVSRVIRGTSDRPRISMHRTNKYLYAQAIDDQTQHTIAAASMRDLKETLSTDASSKLAATFAEKLKKASVDRAVFDRGSFAYKGNIKQFAEALREHGISM